MPHIIVKSKKHGEHKVYFSKKDYNLVHSHTWCIIKSKKNYYCATNIKIGNGYKLICLHVLIMGYVDGCVVDHINRNTLNNRRGNLRHATHSNSCVNRDFDRYVDGQKVVGVYKRVFYRKDGSERVRYNAVITFMNKRYDLGFFKTLDDAIKQRNIVSVRIHGKEFSIQNK